MFPGHDFFLEGNREGTAVRNKVALDALQVSVYIFLEGKNLCVCMSVNNFTRSLLVVYIVYIVYIVCKVIVYYRNILCIVT